MNKKRRQRIEKVCDKLEELLEEIVDIKEEELKCYCNLPKYSQDGIRGKVMYNMVEAMDNAERSIVHAKGCLIEIYED